jgi:hypothetical protein
VWIQDERNRDVGPVVAPEAPPPAPPTRCELTVAGVLGPVLRHACRPESRPAVGTVTVIRARLPHDRDLVDLVRLCEARGVRLVAVTDLGP